MYSGGARRIVASLLFVMLAPAAASGADEGVSDAAVQAQGDETAITIPALTPVEIEIGVELGSKISRTGDRFPIILKAPIIIDGRELAAADAIGEGEVIHAKKAGGSGTSGELVLAARFLTLGDRQLRLRSFRIGAVDKDSVDSVNALNIASAASMVPVGLLGFVITGGNIVYPKGALATVKTADAFEVTISQDPAAVVPPSIIQTEGETTDDKKVEAAS